MIELIDKEEVLKIIDNLSDLSYRWNVARYIINNLPSATPQRPKGKWIKCKSRFGVEYFKCSECGRKLNWIDEDDNYCSNCGTEMSEDCGKQNL